MEHADRQVLARERREPCCLNCGAAITGPAERCDYCDSPLVVVDMPRLMEALLMRHAEPLPTQAVQHLGWPCRACGAPLDPTHSERCGRCHHQVIVPSIVDLRPLLNKVEPLLRAALPRRARPHGAKLKAMRGDASATAVHRYMGHLWDLAGGDGAGVSGWIAFAGLGAAIWYFWF
jgi:hypothetical protein